MCPQCGSRDLACEVYDFGRCSETGYRDSGERWRCRTCGAVGDAEEIEGEMKEYVAGFLFSADRSVVALVCKNRPGWQAGKWNAIGGKIEPTDDCPLHAMRREFCEETGVSVIGWQSFAELGGDGWRLHMYRAFAPMSVVRRVATVTDEVVAVWPLSELPSPMIDNVPWLMRMALSMDASGVDGYVIREHGRNG